MDRHESPTTLALRQAIDQRPASAEDLLPLVYEELRDLARNHLARERPGQTLQPTALVHEAYLRVVGDRDPGWDGRAHFVSAAATTMRRILVDQARRKAAIKRGGDRCTEELDDEELHLVIEPPNDRVLDIDRAVRELETAEPRKGKIVELRFFAGLTAEETAAALNISVRTVEREWRVARAILMTALDGDGTSL